MEDPRTYSDYRTEADVRPEGKRGQAYGDKTKNLYDSMINMIVNHKMELQKIPQCSSEAGAQAWATKRGLRAGTQDFDGDGIQEIVVYNKAGQPMIINGYKPKASDFAMRNAYWTENNTYEKRLDAGPMREWISNKAYDVKEHEDNPWKRTITTTEWGSKLKEFGYKMPTKPKKQFSVFSVFSKLIAPYVRRFFENGALVRLLGDESGPSCATLLKKIISPISMYRMLFMKCVERYYFYHLMHTNDKVYADTYDKFKKYVKSHPVAFWTFFKVNLLDKDDNYKSFKDNIINDEVIARLFVKDEINWDGKDKDDAILFLMGMENIEDQDFSNVIKYYNNADDFLEQLRNGNKQAIKTNKKLIEKWKRRAQKGTKEFFASQQQYLFENGPAYERFLQRVAAGKNPIDPSDDEASPASPTKSVEDKTTLPQAPPKNEEEDKEEEEKEEKKDDVVEDVQDDF